MLLRRTLAQLMAAAALLPAGLSAQARRPLTRIAFGSCAEQANSQPIWDAILAYKPELFIFAGDNVYGDFNTADAGPLRKAYATADAIAGYNKLRDSVSPSRGLGRPRLRPERRRRRLSPQGGVEGSLPRLLEGAGERRAAHARGHLRFAHHRPARHARADHPARHALVPLAAQAHRPARRAGQGALPARSRSGQDDAGRHAMGVARRANCASPPSCACWCRASRCWRKATAGSAGATSRSSARSFWTRSATRAPRASCCCRAIAISVRSIAKRRPTCRRSTR